MTNASIEFWDSLTMEFSFASQNIPRLRCKIHDHVMPEKRTLDALPSCLFLENLSYDDYAKYVEEQKRRMERNPNTHLVIRDIPLHVQYENVLVILSADEASKFFEISGSPQALYPPPPPLVVPHPGKTVPHHPPGDGHQVTVPHPPWGTALPLYTHIWRHRNCSIKRKNSA